MNTVVIRLAAFLAAVLAMSVAAAITAMGHLTDATAVLKTDAFVVGKFEVVSAEMVRVGPVEKAPAVYNVTLPNGETIQVAYLPAGSVVRVHDGWVISFYQLQ